LPRACRFGLDLREQVGRCVLVEIATCRVLRQPACDPAHDPVVDRQHTGVGRDRQQLEPQPGAVFGEHAVGHDEMEVNVHEQRAPEAQAARAGR